VIQDNDRLFHENGEEHEEACVVPTPEGPVVVATMNGKLEDSPATPALDEEKSFRTSARWTLVVAGLIVVGALVAVTVSIAADKPGRLRTDLLHDRGPCRILRSGWRGTTGWDRPD
jgi:hypothetical protein